MQQPRGLHHLQKQVLTPTHVSLKAQALQAASWCPTCLPWLRVDLLEPDVPQRPAPLGPHQYALTPGTTDTLWVGDACAPQGSRVAISKSSTAAINETSPVLGTPASGSAGHQPP